MVSPLLSATDAAKQLGCDPATVRRLCATHGIGQQVARAWILTQADVEKLRQLLKPSRGNPNFVPGNYFGKPKKPAKRRRKK